LYKANQKEGFEIQVSAPTTAACQDLGIFEIETWIAQSAEDSKAAGHS